jgi:predicted RNA binding protein YcfA (HicA-like mRNA interferase family)
MEKAGFQRVRQKSSHLIMQKRTDDGTVTVPVPMHKEIKIGTLQSGISREAFLYN